jgi:hypothetical protein
MKNKKRTITCKFLQAKEAYKDYLLNILKPFLLKDK